MTEEKISSGKTTSEEVFVNNPQPEDYSEVKDFLDDLTEQLTYKPVRRSVRREISAHIEDLMYDYVSRGCDPEEAAAKAVRCMGDSRAIGRELDRLNRPEKSPLLIIVILLCVLSALLVSYLSGWRGMDFFRHNGYFWFGLAVLCLFVKKGYIAMRRHTAMPPCCRLRILPPLFC